MKRQRGELLAALAMGVLFLGCLTYLVWLAWRVPEVQKDVETPPSPETPTLHVIVLPTFTPAPAATRLITPVPPLIDLLPREASTPASAPTPSPTATSVGPTTDKPAVQKG